MPLGALGMSLVFLSAADWWLQRAVLADRIAVPAGGYTERDFRHDAAKFVKEITVEAYTKFGERNPKWDKAAICYVDDNRFLFTTRGERPVDEQLRAHGAALLTAGCSDPLVLYCYALVLRRQGDLAEAERLMRWAVKGLRSSRYPRAWAFLVPLDMAGICQARGGPVAEEVGRWRKLAIDWIGEAAGEGCVHNGGQRVLLAAIDNYWHGLLAPHWREVYDAVRRNPRADLYVALMLGTRCEAAEGRQARGAGTVSEVTRARLRQFDEHLIEARRLCVKAWQTRPDLPEAPAEMIALTTAASGDRGQTPRLWFDRAVAAQVDYIPAYRQMLLALLVRWGGDPEATYSAGVTCAQSGRYDTDIPLCFIASVRLATQSTCDEVYWTRPDTYDRLQSIFARYAVAVEDRDRRRFYQTLHAEFAWEFGRYEEARAAFDSVGPGPLPSEAARYRLSAEPERIRDEVYALSGPKAAATREAQTLHQRGQFADARRLYHALLASTTNEHAVEFYRAGLAAVDWDDRLAQGEWVSLQPDTGLTVWARSKGRWEVEPDGAVRGTSNDDGLLLLCNRRLGHRLELQGEMDFASPAGPGDAPGAVLVGTTRDDGAHAIMFTVDRHSRAAFITVGGEHVADVRLEERVPCRNTFRVQLWDGVINTYLNGQRMHHALKTGKAPGGRVGFGCDGAAPGVVIRFRNLRVRRLEQAPA